VIPVRTESARTRVTVAAGARPSRHAPVPLVLLRRHSRHIASGAGRDCTGLLMRFGFAPIRGSNPRASAL
jgi:hypothetical protein